MDPTNEAVPGSGGSGGSLAEPVLEARMGGPNELISAGDWSLEVRGDELADIRHDGVLLLRAVRPVVRDQDWNTIPVTVTSRHPLPHGTPGLLIRLSFRASGVDYEGDLTLRLGVAEMTVGFEGRARSAFARNRIGLVVLHPARDAGRPVEVLHTDGSTQLSRWPLQISPHQPFTDVAGFAWTRDGVSARLRLSGDVFETEDQRNWTDASFKTYGTPLSRPFPVVVGAGEMCRQSLRLEVRGRATTPRTPPAEVVVVSPTVVAELPPISLGAALYPAPPVAGPATPLTAVPTRSPTYEAVLVELTGAEDAWPGLLAAADRQAVERSAALDVRVVTADPEAVHRALQLLASPGPAGLSPRPGAEVRRVAAFDPEEHVTTPGLWAALQAAAGTAGPSAQLLGGTRAHFTELNRRFADLPEDLPALTFSLTPQMHATEVPHLVDSLQAQRTVAENALRLAGNRPVHIGPVTLARRFNAVATGARPDPATEAARAADPLQPTRFTAAWTLGSVAALTLPGVAGLCYFETAGPRGVLTADGRPTPTAAVLDRLAALCGRPVLSATGPDGIAVLPLAHPGGEVEVMLANLTSEERTVTVRDLAGRTEPAVLAGWSVGAVVLR